MPDDELIGRTIARYTILEKLGEGGMGTVYRARDARLDRLVAFKILRAEKMHDADRRKRFIQEARTASSLNHPNIIAIYDIDSADGVSYIAMEYVAGVTLDQVIARSLRLIDAVKYAIQIADALVAAHAADIIHRDIKPSNVIVSQRGLVKLLDFGLAKLVERRAESILETRTIDVAPMTIEGTIVGTVAYMSPEQAEGLPIDHRSDVFSFGAMLYEMASGRRAFRGATSLSTLSAVLSRDPPPLVDTAEPIPLELERIIARCLRKDRERRIQHMDDVKIALEELLDDLKPGSSVSRSGIAPRALSNDDVAHQPQASSAAVRKRQIAWRTLAPWSILLVGAVAWIVWALTKTETARLAPVLTRLSADAGLSAYPALSPDGSLLAFASDRGGQGSLDIWVQQTRQGQPLRLTTDAADEYEPTFSSDGTTIAFRSDRDGGGIYTVPALGGTLRLIAKGGHRPRFSPDGKWIAYWSGGMGSAFVSGSTNIWVIGTNGGEPRRIASEFAAARHPVWLRDGRLLFIGRLNADVDWWITSLEGGAPTRTGVMQILRNRGLRPPPGDYTINPTDVTLDGRAMLFSAVLGDSANIWQIELSARGEAAGPPQQLTFGTSVEGQPVAAHRASPAVAFSSLAVNVDVWSEPVDAAQGVITGPPQRLTDSLSFEGYADVSRDGRQLSYVAARPGGWDVRLRHLDEEAETTIASGTSPLLQTRMSPDGSHVVYWERDENGRAVYVANTSGGATQKLCNDCGPPTDITPGGNLVLLDSAGPPEAILLANVSSKKITPVIVPPSSPESFLYSARFSPDLKWIAFHAAIGSSTTRRIFIVPYRGERPAATSDGITEKDWIPVTDGTAMDRDPYWSPGGNALYFVSERDGFRCIWMQRVDPATRQPLGLPSGVSHFHTARLSLSTVDPRSSAVSLSLTPTRMFFSLGELTGNIWLATEQTSK
jgi:eukaryotic-like serine/threonine-protein kinase